MGCLASKPKDAGGNKRWPGTAGVVAVFVPGLRIPKGVDLSRPLGNSLSRSLVEHLSALRTRIVVMAAQEAPTVKKPRRKTATQHVLVSAGGSSLADLLKALEDYLPVLLGLVKNGSQLKDTVQFVWVNQEDDAEETGMANAWYEVLSVLHLMSMLCFSEANSLLLPKTSNDDCQPKVSEENRRTSIDVFLKAAGYLDCAIRDVLPQIPPDMRKDLPLDLAEGVLRALCMQALGQAHDSITQVPLTNGYGGKHRLFIKWKYAEAKAAAYYYHGLILDERNTEKSHGMAIAALQAAEEFLKESKRACEAFNAMPPASTNPPLWGSAKYLSEKIPKYVSSKVRIDRDLYSHERGLETRPTLPEFAVAVKPDDYQLPPLDPSWNE
ncbi:uncharacterized protein LOC103716535 isoform X3 [Phoenix dactylifera]|uniref:Uncharacterized protein LOC103716535 isoform X3 n=1 Tax=Phoenix dactylifera TaxID=42345 RepID=A0A8B8J9W2_PHODC|nr:uncharacterized protein LOC103716535 isoform X3 [Phoenix dactylifera]